MADGAVSVAIESLSSLLVQEIKLLGSAKKEVEDIKRELEIIRSFLQDADARAAQEVEDGSNEVVKTWVKQVREEAYRIEDVIDEFSLSIEQLPHGTGLVGVLNKISRFIKKLILGHEIGTEIKEIKSSLANIRERTQTYGLKSIYQEGSTSGTRHVMPHDSRVGSLFIEDTEVVGIDPTKHKLIDCLVNGSLQRSMIAVVGQGGSGKTTLAAKIYNNDSVKKHFDCQAWITVGKEYIKKKLLRTIIQEFRIPGETEKMKEKDIITTLREHLKDKCYMVLFDDVWKLQFWEDVEHALLDNRKSSRIMLTTRNRGVAGFCKQSLIVQEHLLQPLAPDEAWKLFCRKAFRFNTSDGCCPSVLKELSEHIVAKCGGLPLAIAAVGGLLSTKNKDVSEWQNLLDNLGSKLRSDPYLECSNRVLSEGFYDLPHHLKSCLLYFGLFPESYSIKRGRLIRLWIAEGFVQDRKSPSEQVAEEYLAELIDRSLVQVSKIKVFGQAEECRVHDLMHEVILRKTKELGFCRVLNEDQDFNHGIKTRRISAHKDSTDCTAESIKDLKPRSVLFSNVGKLPDAFMAVLFSNFKLLRVVDFERAPLEYLPNEVGKLFNLHYLSVRNTKVKIVPKSIGKLLNLETLDLRETYVMELPIDIQNLKKLRYLLVYSWQANFSLRVAMKIQEGFGSLTDLRRLDFVEVNTSKLLRELGKLRQLRKLRIQVKSNEDVKDLLASVDNIKNLKTLTIVLGIGVETLDLQSVASLPPSLQCFCLIRNYIKKLPDWIIMHQNLNKIWLEFEGSIVDPLKVLQALPNLLSLTLVVKDSDEQLHFKEGWFPKLLRLILCDTKELKLIMIDKGAMPNLKDMYIGPCPLLKEIPTGIQHLRNLKTLLFINMLKEIYFMMKDENWVKVTNHILELGVTYEKELGNYSWCSTKYLSSLSLEEFEQLLKQLTQVKSSPICETTDELVVQEKQVPCFPLFPWNARRVK